MPKSFPSLSHKVVEKEKKNGYCKAFALYTNAITNPAKVSQSKAF